MSHIVRQVYYVPYPSIMPRKRGCVVVMKTKPLGHIETRDLVEGVAYQSGTPTFISQSGAPAFISPSGGPSYPYQQTGGPSYLYHHTTRSSFPPSSHVP